MKKLFSLLVFTILYSGINAQYLNVLDVYVTDDPAGVAKSDTGLTPGGRMIMKIDFQNNLNRRQTLNPGDSVTFGWSVLGTTIGLIGTRSWPATLANGHIAKIYLHDDFPLPRDTCFSFEVCVWPLYNPHQPNTDSTKGNHCTTFKTQCFKSVIDTIADTTITDTTVTDTTKNDTVIIKPTAILRSNDNNSSNFFVVNHSLHFEFPTKSVGNKIELFNLSGTLVLSEEVSNKGLIHIDSDIRKGLYILKAYNTESEIIQKVYIE